MKRGLIVFLVIVAALLALYYVGKNYILPEVIANTVSSDNPPPKFLPDNIEKTVIVLKENVNENVDELPEIMNELNLGFDDILYIVENVEADEVMQSLDELDQRKWTSTNEAYDIVVRNVHIDGYDMEIFRPIFNEKVTKGKLNRVLNAIENKNLRSSVSVPVARNTAKRILLDNREKIESELEKVNGN